MGQDAGWDVSPSWQELKAERDQLVEALEATRQALICGQSAQEAYKAIVLGYEALAEHRRRKSGVYGRKGVGK